MEYTCRDITVACHVQVILGIESLCPGGDTPWLTSKALSMSSSRIICNYSEYRQSLWTKCLCPHVYTGTLSPVRCYWEVSPLGVMRVRGGPEGGAVTKEMRAFEGVTESLLPACSLACEHKKSEVCNPPRSQTLSLWKCEKGVPVPEAWRTVQD